MATDLKTLTPGTAAASSVVVGATSAAAASPSLFTTTGSGSVVLSASPTLTGNTVVSSGSFGLSGNISSAAWTTSGIRYANVAATLTDTSSTGTVATAYTDVFGGNTIAASNATTFTNYYTAWVGAPTAGTNVTFTGKWALGLGGSLQINGGTVTTNTMPALDISQTWNAGAVTFTGLKFNTTDTASASGSLLLDIGTGGGSYSSKFKVDKSGNITATGSLTVPTASGVNPTQSTLISSAVYFNYATGNITWASNQLIAWGDTTNPATATPDLFLRRSAAATLQLGAADVSSGAVAQTLQVQSNTGAATTGPDWSLIGAGGVTSGGAIRLKTKATTTAADCLVLYPTKVIGIGTGLTVATLPAAGTVGRYAYVTDGDGALAWGATVVNSGAGATKYLVWDNGTNWTVAGK